MSLLVPWHHCVTTHLSSPTHRIMYCTVHVLLKGSVSPILRWVLLYIIRKVYSRSILDSHKILSLIKGSVHNLQKTGPCTMIWFFPDNTEIRGKCGLKFATALLSKLILRKSTYSPYCQSFSWFYEIVLRI